MAGSSSSGISGDKREAGYGIYNYWIVKIDNDGTKQWDATFGGNGYDELSAVVQTSDGGYLLTGYSNSSISGDKSEVSKGNDDYWIVKIDEYGTKQWDRTLGGAGDEYFRSSISSSDGGCLLTGFSDSGISGDKSEASKGGFDYWIVKIDNDGVKQWDKIFGGAGYDDATSVVQTYDGAYLLTGFSDSGISGDKSEASKGSFDYWIVKINSIGNKQWDKTYGGSGREGLPSIISSTNGGYLVSGVSNSNISGDKSEASKGSDDYWVVKIDNNGAKRWDKTFGGAGSDGPSSNGLGSIMQTDEGGYFLASSSDSEISGDKTGASKGYSDYWVIKLSEDGTNIPNDIGVVALASPTSSCDLTDHENITVRIKNFTASSQSGFNIGVLINENAIIENLGALVLQPGSTLLYTFRTPVDLSAENSYLIKAFTSLPSDHVRENDTLRQTIRKYPAPNNSLPTNVAICPGVTTQLTATGGVSYLWSTGATSNSISVNPQETTIYSVLVTNELGCSATDSVTVTVQPKLDITLTPDVTICPGVSTQLTATGGGTYAWSNGATTATISVSPLVTTTYSVTVTNEQGCSNTGSVTVNVSTAEKPVVTLTPDVTICPGVPTQLTAIGGGTYAWSTGDTTASISVSPLVTTTYSVTVTNKQGCSATDSVTVNILPAEKPVITINGKNTICQGDSILLTSNLTDNVRWSSGQTTPSIYVKTPGSYSVTATGSSGCTQTSTSVTISVAAPPQITASKSTILCRGDNISLAMSSGDSFQWSTGATTISIEVSPDETTTYSVTTTDAAGCVYQNSLTVTVLQFPPPGQVSKMLPANNIADGSLPLTFSWFPAADATSYDLYVWAANTPKPATPTVTNIGAINYIFSGLIPYGTTYQWQVVARNPCGLTEGSVQTFTLRKLPDLVVSAVEVPASVFSGHSLSMKWEVKNTGSGHTSYGQWQDAVYLSADTVFNVDTDGLLGSVTNQSYLNPQEAYAQTGTFKVPEDITGNYYIFIKTNFKNTVTEITDTNNLKSNISPLLVQLTPPPDLQVTSVIAPQNVFSGQKTNLTWTVTNKGKGPTRASSWLDRIYLSDTTDLNISQATSLEVLVAPSDTLQPDSSYTVTQSVQIPHGIFGAYYLYVQTDATNSVLENAYEANNVVASDSVQVILTPPVDLVVENILAPPSVSNNQPLSIAYTVHNQGNSATYARWQDRIYLSTTDTLTEAVQVGGYYHYSTFIPAGESRNVVAQVTIPGKLTGEYHFYVQVDATNNIFEYQDENNNTLKSSKPVRILHPDLQVASINAPATSRSGQTITMEYVINNAGEGTLYVNPYGGYADKIMLSKTPLYHPDSVILLLDNVRFEDPLPAKQRVTRRVTVKIPDGLEGPYFLTVHTDSSNYVLEPAREDNNIRVSNTPLKVELVWADLQVAAIRLPQTATGGDTLTVAYSTTNKGTAAVANEATWRDKLYISSDSVWQGNGIKVNEYRVSYLQASRRITTSAILPFDLSAGDYYLYVHTDVENDIYEHTFEENNVQRSALLRVAKYLPPDLAPMVFTVPAEGTAGQPSPVSWSILNKGIGPTKAGSWQESVYLSPDAVYNPPVNGYVIDPPIGGLVKKGNLGVNESYTYAQEVFPPVWASGNYYLLLRTDNNERIYEQDENNNQSAVPMTVVQPPPTDLVVTAVNVPSEAAAGDSTQVDWVIQNVSPNPAKGVMLQAVYFSKDNEWDVTDPLFGTYSERPAINLVSQTTAERKLRSTVPALSPGDYYVLVRTDVVNNIYETNDNNNTTASTGKITVRVRELAATDSLPNNGSIYYKIEIPDSLAGETFVVTLEGDSLNGNNELYISYGEVPTRSDHQYSHSNAYSGNQEVIIPALEAGTYYVLVHGSTTTGQAQPIALTSAIVPFSIRSVDASRGGNTGTVTVRIKGAKFEEGMSVKLQKDSTSMVMAYKVMYVDPLTIFASFDLTAGTYIDKYTRTGVTPGWYDVVVQQEDGQTTSLPSGFEVITGAEPILYTNVQHPPSARINRLVAMTIQFANGGDVDIPLPARSLVSLLGAPVGVTIDDLLYGHQDLYLTFRELNGPPEVLRPGAVSSITVYTKAVTGLRFTLREVGGGF